MSQTIIFIFPKGQTLFLSLSTAKTTQKEQKKEHDKVGNSRCSAWQQNVVLKIFVV